MSYSKKTLVFLLLIAFLSSGWVIAQEQVPVKKKLVVGTKEAPPFSMKNKDGDWIGISIDLWRLIASEMKLNYEFRELSHHDLLKEISDGSLDVAATTLTITPERLDSFEFTYPFFTTGLGIAVPLKERDGLFGIIKQFFSLAFMKIIVILILLLLMVGIVLWLLERKKNPQHFGGKATQGIGSGFWFSAVTMTTVGYGDKHPITWGGRIVALVLMLAGTLFVALLTAAITSALTVRELGPTVHEIGDLHRLRVGTIPDTTSEDFLNKNLIPFHKYQSLAEGLQAVATGEVNAFVYDAPRLRYLIKERFHGTLMVLPQIYGHEDYGIALAKNSPLLKPVNRVLLQKVRDPQWQEILYRYLGR